MEERRKLRREKVPARIAVIDRNTEERLGHVGNLSAGGIMLRSKEPLALNRPYDLTLKLPDEVCGYTQLNVTAVSLWCKPGPDSTFYDTGMQISDMPECIEQIIELLVRDEDFQRWVH
jgi:hypothetical protein